MSAYFVAQIAIHDERKYGKYLAACESVFNKFNGEYLAIQVDVPREAGLDNPAWKERRRLLDFLRPAR